MSRVDLDNMPPHNIHVTEYADFQVTLSNYGLGSSMDGLTRRLAASILLTRALIAMIYIILAICFVWACHGLKSLFEIVVLAINSPLTRGWKTLMRECRDSIRTSMLSKSEKHLILSLVLFWMMMGVWVC